MPRLLVVCSLAAVAAVAALVVPAPAGAQAKTNYEVLYHGKSTRAFRLFGIYSTRAAADRIAKWLRDHDHFTAQVRPTNRPVPKIVPRKASADLPVNLTVTMSRARDLFHWCASQANARPPGVAIAFRYPIDGCYARAELMIEMMRNKKYHPYRVWSVANGEPLHARSRNVKAGYVEWGYHVAPILRVREPGKPQKWYVIDPSLFNEPVTIARWENAQKKGPGSPMPYITLTRVGDAPTWPGGQKKPGTGYWPGSDPREGLHKHAVATMKRYKALEGKVGLDLPRDWLASLSFTRPQVPAGW